MNYSIGNVTGSTITNLAKVKYISKLIKEKLDASSEIGSIGGFDFIKDNFYLTLPNGLTSESEVIIYNELAKEFIYIKTINPNWLYQSRDGLLGTNYSSSSLADTKLMLLENETGANPFNNVMDSSGYSHLKAVTPKLTTITKPKEYVDARYDSIEWKSINMISNTNENILTSIRAYNEEQNTNTVNVVPRNKFDMWRLNLPRNGSKMVGNRLAGRWLYLDFTYTNNTNQYNIYNLATNYQNKI
jgi:hypothetical protein